MSEGSRICAADQPSGMTCPETHTQWTSEADVSNEAGLKKPHATAGLHIAVQGAFAVALAVITLQAQAGDAITLWINCILTTTRHRCEQKLPGEHWPGERNWSRKLLKGEHPCLRQGSLQSGRTKPVTLGLSQSNLPQLQGNNLSPECSGQCCTRPVGCSPWTISAEEHPRHGEGQDGRENRAESSAAAQP